MENENIVETKAVETAEAAAPAEAKPERAAAPAEANLSA